MTMWRDWLLLRLGRVGTHHDLAAYGGFLGSVPFTTHDGEVEDPLDA